MCKVEYSIKHTFKSVRLYYFFPVVSLFKYELSCLPIKKSECMFTALA